MEVTERKGDMGEVQASGYVMIAVGLYKEAFTTVQTTSEEYLH